MDINRRIIDDMADKVLREYISGIKPGDAIEGLVSSYGLNTEQTKRLCEISNRKIKVYLTKTQPDQSFTFPLADASQIIDKSREEVGEMEERTKTASAINMDSVDDEWFESILNSGIEKNSSEAATNAERAEKAAFIIVHLDRADDKLSKEAAVLSDELIKKAEELVGYLRKDWLENGDISRSYTAAIGSTDPENRILVDSFFEKSAAELKDYLSAPCVEYSADLYKTAAVNTNSEFAILLRSYIDTRRGLVKTASALKRIMEERKRLMGNYIRFTGE